MADKPWGGVFREATDRRVERFTESISFDRRLAEQDITGSKAHARMLARVGLISEEECLQITQGLEEIGREIAEGRFPFRVELEDIHMHVERALIERIGDVGRKLHTARSRNDQVATDMRLWIREAIDDLLASLRRLQAAFVGRCDRDGDCILPGYTHLQRAQPILAAHYWLAYCEKFERDRQRLVDCRSRVNLCPLGSAALAGTSLPVDRHAVAEALDFAAPTANSLDSVSDRDFVAEFLFCLSLIAVHLSHWAEEWILWSTCEFNFLRLPQGFCTGSSIMPQKINPDVLELIRGKAARVIGSLQQILVLLKGLPLAYNRDLQEDKLPVFESFDTVRDSLELAAPLVTQTEINRAAVQERLDRGYLDATTLMEYLILRGIPQRSAHEAVGRLVLAAMDRNCRLVDLPLAIFQEVVTTLDESVREVLGPESAVRRMRSFGSTAPEAVRQQIEAWKRRLESETL